MSNVLKFLAGLAVILIAAAVVLRIFFVDVAVVGHNAMAPTLIAGDEIVVWRGGSAEMGTIMMCEHPSVPGEFVIGRVVGHPGMTIDTVRGHLRIQGSVATVNFSGDMTFTDTVAGTTDEMRFGVESFGNTDHMFFVKKDQLFEMEPMDAGGGLFLLADNRSFEGQDSRTFGSVNPMSCRGSVFMRLQPASNTPSELGHGWLDLL